MAIRFFCPHCEACVASRAIKPRIRANCPNCGKRIDLSLADIAHLQGYIDLDEWLKLKNSPRTKSLTRQAHRKGFVPNPCPRCSSTEAFCVEVGLKAAQFLCSHCAPTLQAAIQRKREETRLAEEREAKEQERKIQEIAAKDFGLISGFTKQLNQETYDLETDRDRREREERLAEDRKRKEEWFFEEEREREERHLANACNEFNRRQKIAREAKEREAKELEAKELEAKEKEREAKEQERKIQEIAAKDRGLMSCEPCPSCDQLEWQVIQLLEDCAELQCSKCSHAMTFTRHDAYREEARRLNLKPIECRRCREEVWVFVDLSPNKRAARWKCGYCGKEELVTNYVESDGDQRDRNIPTHVKRAVYARDQGQCRFCGSQEDLHYDHDLPFSKGGSNSIENIQLLCSRCNLAKKNKIQ